MGVSSSLGVVQLAMVTPGPRVGRDGTERGAGAELRYFGF